MCYKCSKCGEVVPHGHPMQRHMVYRRLGQRIKVVADTDWQGKHYYKQLAEPGRLEIASEVPVCQGCLDFLTKVG